jgi:hypothetical protein
MMVVPQMLVCIAQLIQAADSLKVVPVGRHYATTLLCGLLMQLSHNVVQDASFQHSTIALLQSYCVGSARTRNSRQSLTVPRPGSMGPLVPGLAQPENFDPAMVTNMTCHKPTTTRNPTAQGQRSKCQPITVPSTPTSTCC